MGKLKTSARLQWSSDVITALGISILQGATKNEIEEQHFECILKKTEATLRLWEVCDLSLLGKIDIVNTLVGSLYVYKMQVLQTTSDSNMAKINDMIQDFILNGRKPKLKMSQLVQNKNSGGLKLVDLKTRDKSLKINWIYRLHTNDVMLTKLAYFHVAPKLQNESFWECNFKKSDLKTCVMQLDFGMM